MGNGLCHKFAPPTPCQWRNQVSNGQLKNQPNATTFRRLAPLFLEREFHSHLPHQPCPTACVKPFQIIFNPTSAAELARMPKELQLQILGEFRGLPQQVSRDPEQFGELEREGRTLHRFRVGDYRVYFERHPLGVVVHRILSRHSLKDFLFRSGLKTGEDEALQENPKFWDMIESARTTAA